MILYLPMSGNHAECLLQNAQQLLMMQCNGRKLNCSSEFYFDLLLKMSEIEVWRARVSSASIMVFMHFFKASYARVTTSLDRVFFRPVRAQ
jgi:hypothetical protein